MSDQTEPIFQRAAADLDLYWLQGGERRVGFRASAGANLGDTPSLSQGWTDAGGLWFWLDSAPADDAAFAADLTLWLQRQPTLSGPRLLWLAGVAGNAYDWRASNIGLARSGTTTSVSNGYSFNASGVVVMVARGAQVSPGQAAADGPWQFSFQGGGLTLFADDNSFSAIDARYAVTYATSRCGALRWDLELPHTDGSNTLAQMGVSLRYFAPDIVSPGGIRTLRVTPLRQSSAITLYCAFDPLFPLDPVRTRFALLPFGSASTPPPQFTTGYVTAHGYGVQLTPQATASDTPPGFVLAQQPMTTGGEEGSATPVLFYLTPDGDFQLATAGSSGSGLVTAQPTTLKLAAAPVERLLCGTTGLEYIGLAATSGTTLSFRAGHAAYVPPISTAETTAAGGDGSSQPSLSALGTTAWSWITSSGNPRYYAQPENAPFYAGGNAGFLNYLEMAAVELTTPQSLPAFPMVGYAGLEAEAATLAKELEARGIAPERRRQIALATSQQWQPSQAMALAATAEPTVVPAVSPPGLAIGYAGDELPWSWLAIGNNGNSSDGLPDLRFTAVEGAFRQALLSNRLFMVLGSADTVLASGSVAYQLTSSSLNLIKGLPNGVVTPEIWAAVEKAVREAGYPVYHTETTFNAMLHSATNNAINAEQQLIFQRFAGLLTPLIGDWLFRLSPRNWAAPDRQGPKNARLIFKFVSGRSLAELVDDTAAWSWPEAATDDGDVDGVRREINSIIRAAREAQLSNPAGPYENFLQMVDDPYWIGVLALSVEVPLDELPEPIQPLAAGIDPASFYAHHLGLTATAFTSGGDQVVFDTTSSFGLIDYQNPEDQYFSSDIAFAFRVQQLTVGFENGKLSSFASVIQLMVNRLFGAQTRLFPSLHGNNLILDGVYQSERDDGGGERNTYVFALREAGSFQLQLGQLSTVGVSKARMVTLRAADPASGDTNLTAAFQLSGRLSFAEPDNFDPFCWGDLVESSTTEMALFTAADEEPTTTSDAGLAYSNYAVTMSFSLSDPSVVHFSVADTNVTLDTANSPARPNSLFARFPLRLTGLMTTPDPAVTGGEPSSREPTNAGFVSVSAPIQQGKLTQPWYGLVYEVDLGTLGALAGSVGITIRLLAAWSPAGGDKGSPAIYFGVALPGIENALGVSLPLQGILDIGFRTIQFATYNDAQGRRQYLMRLRDFGLHVLGLSFPPGHNDITVFGNPDQSSNTKLGWYAAYDNGQQEQQKPPSSPPITTLSSVTPQRPSSATAHELGRLVRTARPARLDPPKQDPH